MDHSNKPIIDNSDEKPQIRPFTHANFGAPLYPIKDVSIAKAKERAKNTHAPCYVVEFDDGYIAVNYGEYFSLFGDEPGDDVVFKAEP
jgi:hypothetical protein